MKKDKAKAAYRQLAEESALQSGDASEKNIQKHLSELLEWDSQMRSVTQVATFKEKAILILALVLIFSGVASMLVFFLSFFVSSTFYSVGAVLAFLGIVLAYVGLRPANHRLQNLPLPPAIIIFQRRVPPCR